MTDSNTTPKTNIFLLPTRKAYACVLESTKLAIIGYAEATTVQHGLEDFQKAFGNLGQVVEAEDIQMNEAIGMAQMALSQFARGIGMTHVSNKGENEMIIDQPITWLDRVDMNLDQIEELIETANWTESNMIRRQAATCLVDQARASVAALRETDTVMVAKLTVVMNTVITVISIFHNAMIDVNAETMVDETTSHMETEAGIDDGTKAKAEEPVAAGTSA